MIIPFHKQELWYSCFAACIRMILEFHGIKKSENELRKLFKINSGEGGMWFWVEYGLESLGLHFYWSYGFSLGELKELTKNETPVIVSLKFAEKHPNHTIVVTDVTNESITAHDPETGENIKLKVSEFLEAWSKRGRIAGYIKI